MAIGKMNSISFHSPGKLLCLVLMGLFFLRKAYAHSLTFDFPKFDPYDRNIAYKGIASANRDTILLTVDQQDNLLNENIGRATYAQPLHLWDKASGKLANFYTNFSFSVSSLEKSLYGDGMAFFLAPVDFPLPNREGGGLGLAVENFPSAIPFVAVEFDTYSNEWDPSFNHVGIDINSTISEIVTEWFGIMEESKCCASISYDSGLKQILVTLTDNDGNNLLYKNPTLNVDLRDHLPEWVSVGFSASTGEISEIHTLYSWHFYSSLQINDKPINVAPIPNPPSFHKSRSNKILGLIIGLCIGNIFVLLVVAYLFRLCKKRRAKKDDHGADLHVSMSGAEKNYGVDLDKGIDDDFEKATGPRKFSYKDLAVATSNFSELEKLGEGGFGAVYKGLLKELNCYVAVKRVSSGSKQGVKEYASEVTIISRLRHKNLVKLIGWCHEGKELLLVYEFMSNGSLDSHLFKEDSFLTWEVRYKIAQGVASGLLYLQEELDQCVVHRDIKSSNIMLDLDFNAKLGDFGLARLMDHGKGLETTVLAGTIGYMAPECFTTGKASKESDVFSFGIVALEIACGRKPINNWANEDQIYMVQWVWDMYGKGNLLEAADPRLHGDFDKQQVERLMIIGLWCAHPDAKFRPSMRQAIQVLNFESPSPFLPSKMPMPTYFPPSAQSFLSLSLEATGSRSDSLEMLTKSDQTSLLGGFNRKLIIDPIWSDIKKKAKLY